MMLPKGLGNWIIRKNCLTSHLLFAISFETIPLYTTILVLLFWIPYVTRKYLNIWPWPKELAQEVEPNLFVIGNWNQIKKADMLKYQSCFFSISAM